MGAALARRAGWTRAPRGWSWTGLFSPGGARGRRLGWDRGSVFNHGPTSLLGPSSCVRWDVGLGPHREACLPEAGEAPSRAPFPFPGRARGPECQVVPPCWRESHSITTKSGSALLVVKPLPGGEWGPRSQARPRVGATATQSRLLGAQRRCTVHPTFLNGRPCGLSECPRPRGPADAAPGVPQSTWSRGAPEVLWGAPEVLWGSIWGPSGSIRGPSGAHVHSAADPARSPGGITSPRSGWGRDGVERRGWYMRD